MNTFFYCKASKKWIRKGSNGEIKYEMNLFPTKKLNILKNVAILNQLK